MGRPTLKPFDYLDHANVVSEFDKVPALPGTPSPKEQYKKGLDVGQNAIEVFVNANGAWGSINNDASQTTSYEVIGYHRNTSEFWRGILDSGCKIIVYDRWTYEPTVIREASA
jgi:hypothetical protein